MIHYASRLPQVNYRTPYSPIAPYKIGYLPVSDIHQLYFEESGNPKGKPVVWLHGGPGSGTSPWIRQLFDPNHYRIILFDQRGCGRSRPLNSLEENTTWHLVEDLEKLRKHVGIEKWIVTGGSWGSTLGLAYAQTYPEAVAGMFIRAIFLGKKRELDWAFAQGGASQIYPEVWKEFIDLVPVEQRNDIITFYYHLLINESESVKQKATLTLGRWEMTLSNMYPDEQFWSQQFDFAQMYTLSLLEMYYSQHQFFLERDGDLLKNMDRIRHIPAVIAHGRYDMICSIQSAFELHQAWPEAEFWVIPDAGHTIFELAGTHHAIEIMDRFRSLDF